MDHVTDLVLCIPPGLCGSRVDEVTHASCCILLGPRPTIISLSLASTRLLLLPLIHSPSKKLLVDRIHSSEDFTELSDQRFFILGFILAQHDILVVILDGYVLEQGGVASQASHILRELPINLLLLITSVLDILDKEPRLQLEVDLVLE